MVETVSVLSCSDNAGRYSYSAHNWLLPVPAFPHDNMWRSSPSYPAGDATVIRIIRIIPAAIGNRGDGVRADYSVILRAVYGPRSAFQRGALSIDLIPFDRGAGGGIRTIPRQIVALLIHIQCGSGMATFVVDERIELCRPDRYCLPRQGCTWRNRSTDPYATVGTHMRFKAAVRYENATEHARSRVIVGFHGEQAIPYVIILLSCRILGTDES